MVTGVRAVLGRPLVYSFNQNTKVLRLYQKIAQKKSYEAHGEGEERRGGGGGATSNKGVQLYKRVREKGGKGNVKRTTLECRE